MKIYTELELLGFFRWLLETHELSYTEGISPKYLDGLPLTDIHRTVCNAMSFRWFREQFNWQSSIEATNDQHSHQLGYNHFIWNNITSEEYHTMPKDRPSGDWCFKTYEEAQKECIMDLISIIKNQKK
jgi:hypothetical protein